MRFWRFLNFFFQQIKRIEDTFKRKLEHRTYQAFHRFDKRKKAKILAEIDYLHQTIG